MSAHSLMDDIQQFLCVKQSEQTLATANEHCIDVTPYLNQRQDDVAKMLGMSTSTLSRVWRANMASRKWPYRQLCKIDKLIGALQPQSPRYSTRIAALQAEREVLLQPVKLFIPRTTPMHSAAGSRRNSDNPSEVFVRRDSSSDSSDVSTNVNTLPVLIVRRDSSSDSSEAPADGEYVQHSDILLPLPLQNMPTPLPLPMPTYDGAMLPLNYGVSGEISIPHFVLTMSNELLMPDLNNNIDPSTDSDDERTNFMNEPLSYDVTMDSIASSSTFSRCKRTYSQTFMEDVLDRDDDLC